MECGECTLCCKLLELHEIPSPIGTYCQHCDISRGCKIHDGLPEECRTYKCMWLQMENAGAELRPDKCGIIFNRTSEDVITARLDEGKLLSQLVQGQINAFVAEGFSLLIFRGQEKKFYLNDNHTEEYVMEKVRGRADIY